MASTEEIVLKIQHESNIARGPETPLYRFKISTTDLEDLRSDLAFRLAKGEDGSILSAGFCLYGAHAFRRRHRGGTWTWETILTPLGLHFSAEPVYRWVDRGLKYWQRDILSGSRREWLATLVCEGGLPSTLFESDGASLGRYFRQLLATVEAHPQLSVASLAERAEVAECLPRSLRVRIVFSLAAEIVNETLRLRKLIPEGTVNPLSHLDRVNPDWRQAFPVEISIDAAKSLFSSLLVQQVRLFKTPVAIELTLDIDRRRMTRRARVEPDVEASQLAKQFDLTAADLPNRFRLGLRSDTGARLPIAVATSFGDRYRLDPLPQTFSLQTNEAFEIIAFTGDRILAARPAPGGEPLDQDTPWLFVGDESRPEFLGAGSTKTHHAFAFVCVPNGAILKGQHDSTQQLTDRSVARFEGSLQVTFEDESWELTTGSERNKASRYLIQSTPRQIGGGGTSVYLGLPQLWSVEEERPVPSTELEWRAIGTKHWKSVSDSDPVGDIVIRQQGALGIRARLRILPSRCTWTFEGLQHLRSGSIAIDLVHTTATAFEINTQGVHAASLAEATTTPKADLSVDETPPRFVNAILKFEEGGRLPLRLPFPTERRRFTNYHGHELESRTTVSVRELSSLRAVIQSPDTKSVFTIRAKAKGAERILMSITNMQEGLREIELASWVPEIEAMLGSADGLDDEVTIRISKEGAAEVGSQIYVARFDARLDKLKHDEGFLIAWNSHLPIPDDVRMKAAPFSGDLDEWTYLEPDEPGSWLFRTQDWGVGSYLVVCEAPFGIAVRPIRVTKKGSQSRRTRTSATSSGVVELADISGIMSARERMRALHAVLNRLENNPHDSNWPHITTQMAMVRQVPAASLDLARAVISHPIALIGVLLRDTALTPDLMTSLESLPFQWHLLPLHAWRSACLQFEKDVDARLEQVPEEHRQGLPKASDLVRSNLQKIMEILVPHDPALYLITAAAPKVFGLTIEPFLASPVPDSEQFAKSYQRMLRREIHPVEHRWPNFSWRDTMIRLELPPSITGKNTVPGRLSVMNAPEVAAWTVASASSFRLTAPEILEIRRCEAFDEDWFEVAYLHTLSNLLKDTQLI